MQVPSIQPHFSRNHASCSPYRGHYEIIRRNLDGRACGLNDWGVHIHTNKRARTIVIAVLRNPGQVSHFRKPSLEESLKITSLTCGYARTCGLTAKCYSMPKCASRCTAYSSLPFILPDWPVEATICSSCRWVPALEPATLPQSRPEVRGRLGGG